MIHQAQQLRHWSHTIGPDYPGIAQTMRNGAAEIERLWGVVRKLRDEGDERQNIVDRDKELAAFDAETEKLLRG